MNKYFWVHKEKNILKTYNDLVSDLNQINYAPLYLYSDNVYEYFISLISSILNGTSITILDSNLSNAEIESLCIDKNSIHKKIDRNYQAIISVSDLINKLSNVNFDWRLELYTSGTTGRPKSIKQDFNLLTRNVKKADKFNKDIWGFCYNPTHFAGLQIFFQALMNLNTMVYLFSTPAFEISNNISNYNINALSFTPTFFRQFIAFQDIPFDFVNRITFGGEKFSPELLVSVKKYFPNAKINNVYASTEAGSLFASQNGYFEISEKIKNFIKIQDDGELLVNKKLIGESNDIVFENNWFHTGDIVQLVDENKFVFVSRKSEMINVGGYKVNPNEIEQIILQIKGILDVIVYGRKNSVTGQLLVADVVLSSQVNFIQIKQEIIKLCSDNLQEWKIPRIIKQVEKIILTRTGKKIRN